MSDGLRSRSQLILENPLLRQQVARLCLTKPSIAGLVLLASQICYWQQALLIVQPDTLLNWRRKSQTVPRPPCIARWRTIRCGVTNTFRANCGLHLCYHRGGITPHPSPDIERTTFVQGDAGICPLLQSLSPHPRIPIVRLLAVGRSRL